MGNLVHLRWRQYYQVPIDQRVERLSPTAHLLCCLLWQLVNHSSAVVVELTNAEIAARICLKDHKTINRARKELIDAGLITVSRVPHGVYAHTMLGQNGKPIPPPKGRTGVRRYKAVPPQPNPGEGTAASFETSTRARARAATSTGAAEPLPLPPPREPVAGQHPTEDRPCHTHGLAEHWRRGEDWVCARCHPNPSASAAPVPTASEVPFHVPTADEIFRD
jgi:hypothetical protein